MLTFDIKSSLPTVEEAKQDLLNILTRSRKEKVIKIIHGYGSKGEGGAIKQMTHRILNQERQKRMIHGYIPGEATATLMGYDELIATYRHLLKNDTDFYRGNDGITYVIF